MEDLRVTRTLVIPFDELAWRFMPSGGPGGQHANRSNTRVEVRFDIEGSPSLGPRQRERLLDKLGPSARVTVDDERSQGRNRAIALERLQAKLAEALRIETPRRPTRPSLGAKKRRLEAKRRQS
jgi:ribosome-associated protein